jgi:hypothetical protein
VAAQAGVHRAVLDHGAVGSQVAAQHGDTALVPERPLAWSNHRVVVDQGALEALGEGTAKGAGALEVEQVPHPSHQSA